jgi:hypothetical protein
LVHGFAQYNPIGSIKASQAGDRLGLALNGSPGTFELYDFDKLNGAASLVMSTSSADYMFAYGVEFSPNGNLMYGSEYGSGYHIYQFDLLAGSGAAIAASALLVGISTGYTAALQLGPDKKIYIAKWFETSLATIDDPDQLGMACNFTDVAVSFPLQCLGGLPNIMAGFIQSIPLALFSAPHHICPGTCTNFINLSQNATSYQWNFSGGNPSTSVDANPISICYNTPGTYTVQLIASNSVSADTLTLNNYITVFPNPPPQGIAQNGDTLFANQGATSYQWYHDGTIIAGATDYFYVSTQGGNFNVVATDENDCEVEAAIFDVIAATLQMDPKETGLHVYADPIKNQVVVSGALLSQGAMVCIYNMLGEKIYFDRVAHDTGINIETYVAGMYVVEVSSRTERIRTKFIKPACR